MNGRIYDPVLARFLSPDPYVQAPDFTQNYNRYAYCLNNPFKYTDPSGEIAWFVPVIVGAVIGAYSGGVIANEGQYNPVKWDYNSGRTWGYMLGGGLIGGLSGSAAAGIGLIGGSPWLAGAVSGAISGAGFSGLSTNWNPEAMLKGAAIAGLSGLVGGGLGAAIGGGWGAFTGGAASAGLNTALNGGTLKQTLTSMLLGGTLSYTAYELTSYIGWETGGNRLVDNNISYKQYKTMQADFQRSRFWRKEYGGFLLEDGNVSRFPASWRHSHGITPPDGSEIKVPSDAFAMYHTHWDTSGKTIWVNPLGQRVDNSSNPLDLIQPGVYKTSTSRGHSPTDFLSIDSYVINRYETVFNAGRTSVLNVIRDPFLRYFPWYLIYMK